MDAKEVAKELRCVRRDGVWVADLNEKAAHPICAASAKYIEAQAAEIERLRLELAGRDAPLRPFRFGNYIKSEEDLTEYRRAIIEGVEAEIAAWLQQEAEGEKPPFGLVDEYFPRWALRHAATAIASGEYRKGEG